MRHLKSIFIVLLGIMTFGIDNALGQAEVLPPSGEEKREGLTCAGDLYWNPQTFAVNCVCYEDPETGSCDGTSVGRCAKCYSITEKFVTDDGIQVYDLHLPILEEHIEIVDWTVETKTLDNGATEDILNYTPYSGEGG